MEVWGLAPDMGNKITETGTAKVKKFPIFYFKMSILGNDDVIPHHPFLLVHVE